MDSSTVGGGLGSSNPAASNEQIIFDEMMAYALESHRKDLLNLLKQPQPDFHYSIICHMMLLVNECPKVYKGIFQGPDLCFAICDSALVRAAEKIYEEEEEEKYRTDQSYNNNEDSTGKTNTELIPKKNIHLRVVSMADWAEVNRAKIPRTADYGKFLSVRGKVIRCTMPQILEYKREYRCSQCGHQFTLHADYEDQKYAFPKLPSNCPNPEQYCASKSLCLVEPPVGCARRLTHCKDYQEIKLQDVADSLAPGVVVPRSMWITLEHDLVDSCQPGDDVTVCGQVKRRWQQPFIPDERMILETVLKVNSLVKEDNVFESIGIDDEELANEFKKFWTVHYNHTSSTTTTTTTTTTSVINDSRTLMSPEQLLHSNPRDFFFARDLILKSFCPDLYGLFLVKLSAAVVLAGGVSRVDASGTRVRGQCHLLMVGDPGAGKSQIMKYVCRLSPRSVFTTGIGTTNAGLTASAVKDSGEWHLEAGALVLADGGVCCIDEFSSIASRPDSVSIHEAMEQQTVSVAKAGIVCKLSTRCSIFAATNPCGGSYDPNKNAGINSGLSSPLLSRFDLILVLRDRQDPAWDQVVARHILEMKDGTDSANLPACPMGNDDIAKRSDEPTTSMEFWTFKRLRSYFTHIKQLKPVLNEQASRVLSAYYLKQRRSTGREAATTTVRMLESIIRLAQGHARLMYRDRVTLEDAVSVIALMEASQSCPAFLQSSSSNRTNMRQNNHQLFPEDPMTDYRQNAVRILTQLSLEDLLPEIETSLEATANYYQTLLLTNERTDQSSLASSTSSASGRDFITYTQQVLESINNSGNSGSSGSGSGIINFNERKTKNQSDDGATTNATNKKNRKWDFSVEVINPLPVLFESHGDHELPHLFQFE